MTKSENKVVSAIEHSYSASGITEIQRDTWNQQSLGIWLREWPQTYLHQLVLTCAVQCIASLGKAGFEKSCLIGKNKNTYSRNTPTVGNIHMLILSLSSNRCGFAASILDCICLWKKWIISLFLDSYSSYLFKTVLAAMWWACIWNSCHRLSIIL